MGHAAVVLGLLEEEVVWGGPGSFLKVLVAAERGLQVKGSGAQELEGGLAQDEEVLPDYHGGNQKSEAPAKQTGGFMVRPTPLTKLTIPDYRATFPEWTWFLENCKTLFLCLAPIWRFEFIKCSGLSRGLFALRVGCCWLCPRAVSRRPGSAWVFRSEARLVSLGYYRNQFIVHRVHGKQGLFHGDYRVTVQT